MILASSALERAPALQAGSACNASTWEAPRWIGAPWQHWRALQPDSVALFNGSISKTWRQMCEDISCVERKFPLFSSPYLAILSDNHYETLITMLAAWQHGLKTLMLNPGFCENERLKILGRAGIEHFIEPFAIKPRSNILVNPSHVDFDLNDHLTLTLTSGSTGAPKAVMHSAKNHLASAQGLFSSLPFEKTDTWLLSLPLFHVSGLAIVWRWLLKGAKIKIADIKGEALHAALEGVTHASLVPTQLQRILKKPKPQRLRSVLLGGAAISPLLVQEAQRQGIDCWCGYGMTEMASTITAKRATPSLKAEKEEFSVGNVLPFRQLKLSPKGEIWVKGETLSSGYLDGGKHVPLAQNWFATKDLAHWVGKSEELKLLGRLDNMFICGGENIQPESIEQKLRGYPGVLQLFILPLDHEKWGQAPAVVIQGNVDIAAFLLWAKTRLPVYQCPHWGVKFPDDWPHMGIKISRKALIAWLKTQQI